MIEIEIQKSMTCPQENSINLLFRQITKIISISFWWNHSIKVFPYNSYLKTDITNQLILFCNKDSKHHSMKMLWNKSNNNWMEEMLDIQLHKSLLTFIDLFMLFLLTFLLGLELKTRPSADAQTEIAHSFWVIFLCWK